MYMYVNLEQLSHSYQNVISHMTQWWLPTHFRHAHTFYGDQHYLFMLPVSTWMLFVFYFL